jgi:hypothetical protein
MRSISSSLLAAQQSPSATPYILVILALGGGSYMLTTENDRVYSVEHEERPFGGRATIRLKNNDKWFSGMDFRGWQVGVGYGYNGEYSIAAPLWCVSHQDVSLEGQLLTELICIDIFQKFSWFGVGPDPNAPASDFAAPAWEKDKTIHQIIDQLITTIDPPLPALVVDSNDGIIDTYKPYYIAEVNYPVLSILSDLTSMTKSGMRQHSDGTMHILYLNPSEGACYSYDSAHAFFSEVRSKGVVMPNIVIYLDHIPTAEEPTVTYRAVAQDAESIARIGRIPVVKAPPASTGAVQGITSNEEAQQLANNFLERLRADVNQGRVLVPHQCSQELYDMIQVTDSRAGVTFTGRVGGLIHRYDSGEVATAEGRNYTLEIYLGGLMASAATYDIDRVISGIVGQSNAVPEWPLGRAGGTTAAPTSALAKAYQNWSTTVQFLPGDQVGANLHNAIHWTAGQVIFADGDIISVNPGQLTNITDMVWVYWDLTSPDPSTLKWTYNLEDCVHPKKGMIASAMPVGVGGIIVIWAPGGSGLGGIPDAVVVTPSIASAAVTSAKIADGAVINAKVAQEAIDSGKLANLAVTTAKMADAIVTAQKLASSAVTHDKIVAGAIWGNVVAAGAIVTEALAVGAVSADKIAANAVVADKIAANAVLTDKIATNAITAGKIAAGQVQAWHISVTSLSAISANLGIITTGCIRPTWGSLYWQGGLYLTRMDGAVGWGWLGDVGTGMMEVRSVGSIPLMLSCGAGGSVFVAPNSDQWGPRADGRCNWYFRTWNIAGNTQLNHSFAPVGHFIGCLGYDDHAWAGVYTYALKVAVTIGWQGHDDVELIKAIKSKEVGGKHVIDTNTLPPQMVEPCPTIEDQGEWSRAVSEQVDHFVDMGSMLGLMLGSMQQVISRLEKLEKHR